MVDQQQSQFDLQKVYTPVSPVDQLKFDIIKKMTELREQHMHIQSMMLLHKADKQNVKLFIANVLSLYWYIKPHILRHIKQTKEAARYKPFVQTMDWFVMYPSKCQIEDAIAAYGVLNQFCEEFRLISLTYWYGGVDISQDKSVYRV